MTARATVGAPGQSVFVDLLYLGPSTNAPGNLLTYDEYSTEHTEGGWGSEQADCVRTRIVHRSGDGGWELRVNPTSGPNVYVQQARAVPVVAGTLYRFGAEIRTQSGGGQTVSVTGTLTVEWLDGDGQSMGIVPRQDYFSYGVEHVGVFGILLNRTFEAPAGAAYCRPIVDIRHDASTTATHYLLDKLTLVETVPGYTLVVSDRTGSVTLTMTKEATPGRPLITVLRYDGDGRSSPVRGYDGDMVRVDEPPVPYVIEDYEAPMGRRVWYEVRRLSDAPGGDWTTTAVVDGPRLPDSSFAWVKHPGLPALNRTAMVASPITWQRAARRSSYDVVGRVSPIVVSGTRSGRTGALELLVWDEAANESLNTSLDNGLPLLVQAMPGYGLPGNLYVSPGSSTATQITGAANEPGWLWSLEITEIDRPAGGIQGSANRTWQDVLDEFDSWADLLEVYATWADVLTDTRIGGA